MEWAFRTWNSIRQEHPGTGEIIVKRENEVTWAVCRLKKNPPLSCGSVWIFMHSLGYLLPPKGIWNTVLEVCGNVPGFSFHASSRTPNCMLDWLGLFWRSQCQKKKKSRKTWPQNLRSVVQDTLESFKTSKKYYKIKQSRVFLQRSSEDRAKLKWIENHKSHFSGRLPFG